MIDPMKEIEELSVMIDWTGKNIDKLPFVYQVRFLNALMNFCDELKPIYVNGLMMLGSGEDSVSGEDSDDEEEDEDEY